MINIILGVAIDTGVNASIFINKIDYNIPLVMGIYYSLNDTIGLNVLNIGLVYLLLA